MKRSIRPFENVFSVISLILFSQGFYPVILGTGGSEEGDIDSPLLRLIFILIYFVTIALLLFRWQRTLYFLKSNLWLLFLIGLALASITWATVPEITFRKVIALIGTTNFGIYLGSRYTFEQQLKIYGWVFGIAIFFSFFFALFMPKYGIMNTNAITGAWRGIYPHKNGLGESMFASFLTFYFLSLISQSRQLLFWVFCFLSVVLIFFGKSATALMSVVFIFSTAQGLSRLSLKSKRSVFFVLLFLIFACFALLLITINFNTFLSVNDKDVTLSGRTLLWDTLWDFIIQRPWLGYGYGSFFSSAGREVNLLWQVHGWSPVHAHNGYVQLWLNLGLTGLIIFIFGYLSCLFNSLFRYLVSKDPQMLWVFLFLIYTVFLNLTEVSFVGANSIIWIISLASIYSMKKIKITPAKVTT